MTSKPRWPVLLGVVAGLGFGFGLRLGGKRHPAYEPSGASPAAWQPAAREYPVNEGPTTGIPAETAEAREEEVAAILDEWRSAILLKDADKVVRLDGTFREAPERYLAAVAKSASSDGNERVRAFSTRVLGKLSRTESAPELKQLLTDPSPYVRQNAAWALGELGRVAGGRVAARSALGDLKRIEARDPARDVRSAARIALAQLE